MLSANITTGHCGQYQCLDTQTKTQDETMGIAEGKGSEKWRDEGIDRARDEAFLSLPPPLSPVWSLWVLWQGCTVAEADI